MPEWSLELRCLCGELRFARGSTLAACFSHAARQGWGTYEDRFVCPDCRENAEACDRDAARFLERMP